MTRSLRGAVFGLAEGVPADVGEHGAAYNQTGDEEGSEDAGPEAHAAEGNEEDALLAGEIDARLAGQEGFDCHGDQKTCGPYEGDSKRELQGNVHH